MRIGMFTRHEAGDLYKLPPHIFFFVPVLPLGSLCVPLNCNTCTARVIRFVSIMPYGHTFAVNSLRAGDDIKTVQGNLGHATAAFTLDNYGHVTESMRRESAERMEIFIKNVMGL